MGLQLLGLRQAHLAGFSGSDDSTRPHGQEEVDLLEALGARNAAPSACTSYERIANPAKTSAARAGQTDAALAAQAQLEEGLAPQKRLMTQVYRFSFACQLAHCSSRMTRSANFWLANSEAGRGQQAGPARLEVDCAQASDPPPHLHTGPRGHSAPSPGYRLDSHPGSQARELCNCCWQTCSASSPIL